MNDKIDEIKECPHCGSTMGYYQKVKGKYSNHYNYLFETGEAYNTEMWDGVTDTWRSKFYFCMECDKRICRVSE